MFLSLTAPCTTRRKKERKRSNNCGSKVTCLASLFVLIWRQTIDYDSYRSILSCISFIFPSDFYINVSFRDRVFVRWHYLRKRRIAVKGLSILSSSKKVKYRMFPNNYVKDLLKDTWYNFGCLHHWSLLFRTCIFFSDNLPLKLLQARLKLIQRYYI